MQTKMELILLVLSGKQVSYLYITRSIVLPISITCQMFKSRLARFEMSSICSYSNRQSIIIGDDNDKKETQRNAMLFSTPRYYFIAVLLSSEFGRIEIGKRKKK